MLKSKTVCSLFVYIVVLNSACLTIETKMMRNTTNVQHFCDEHFAKDTYQFELIIFSEFDYVYKFSMLYTNSSDRCTLNTLSSILPFFVYYYTVYALISATPIVFCVTFITNINLFFMIFICSSV